MAAVVLAKIVSSGRYIAACCPLCITRGKSPDTKYHLYILKDAYIYCYRCGYKSSYKWFIANFTINLQGNQFRVSNADIQFTEFDSYIAQNTTQHNNSSVYSRSALAYLLKRNIPKELIQWMDIRLGTNKMFGRVVFVDSVNKYFMGRAFIPLVFPKTMNPSGNTRPLMYFDKLRTDTLYIVEGVFDAIPFVKTLKNVCVLLGKDIAQNQIKQLCESKANVIISCLDSDARQSSVELCHKISGCLPLTSIGLYDYKNLCYRRKDPGDYDMQLFDNVDLVWIRKLHNNIEI